MNRAQAKNILLVDDDPFLQSLYRRSLEREGFNLLTANDGLAALEKLSDTTPDLVVLDLMMPKLDGLQLLESIRSNRRHLDLPVLIVSNAYLPQVAQKALKSGATSGILKSECSPKRLAKIIRELLDGVGSKTTNLVGTGSLPALKLENVESEDAASSTDSVAAEFQNELIKSWPADLAIIRGLCLKYAKAAGCEEADGYVKDIYRRLRLLSARTTMAGWSQASELSSALEAMLFERGFHAQRTMPQSAIQTMFQAVDCLEYLLKSGHKNRLKSARQTRILLVDDDPVCNCANEMALKRLNFDTTRVGDGASALTLLENTTFDLILMDINMPVLSGLEVCTKLREIPRCKETPVIFVTIQDDFKSRTQSVLSGGNGLIAKPISPVELIVKTLIFLLKAQNGAASQPATAIKAQPKNEFPALEKTAVDAVAPAVLNNPPKTKEPGKNSPATEVEAATPASPIPANTPVIQTTSNDELAAACVRRMGELEVALAATLKEEKKLQLELETAGQGPARIKLEDALAASRNQQKILVQEIEQAWKEFENQQLAAAGDESIVEAPPQPVPNQPMAKETAASAGTTTVEQNHDFENAAPQISNMIPQAKESTTRLEAAENRVRELNEALNAESKRCEQAEQEVARISQQKNKLESELAAVGTTQTQLRSQLAEQKQLMGAQIRTHAAEVGLLAERAKELETSHAAAQEKVAELNEALTSEQQRYKTAEQQLASSIERRSALETELAVSKQAEEQLRSQLSDQQQRLESEVDAHKSTLENLKELEAGRLATDKKIREIEQALSAETQRRDLVEQQLASSTEQRSTLETELAASKQAQEQQRIQLTEQQQRLQSEARELKAALEQLEELKASRLALDEKVQELEKVLSAETQRRELVEQRLANSTEQRNVLETELAASKQAQEQQRIQLTEQQQRLQSEARELKAALEQLEELKASRLALDEKVQELEQAFSAETQRRELAVRETTDLRQQRDKFETELSASVQAQVQLTAQLTEKCSAERAWLACESELHSCIRDQKDKLAESAAKLSSQELETQNAQKQIEVLQTRESMLDAQVKDLTTQVESAAETLQEWQAKTARSERDATEVRKEMAEMRYAILDASRMNTKLNRERLQQDRQGLDAVRQQLLLLAQTPLSLGQRRMLAELQGTLDGQMNQRDNGKATFYPVESPDFHNSEFCFAEVAESAFQDVRAAAIATGTTVRLTTSGAVSGNLIGCALQIHQMIILLATPPLVIKAAIKALDLNLAVKAGGDRYAEMEFRLTLSVDQDAQDLVARLLSITAAATTLQATSLNESEFGLAAGWQLALALGAHPVVELGDSREARVTLSLPLQTTSDAPMKEAPAAATVAECKGNTNVVVTMATATTTS